MSIHFGEDKTKSIVRSTADELKAELKAEFRDTVANLTSMIEDLKQSIIKKNERISDLEQRVINVVQQNVNLAGELSETQSYIENVVEVGIHAFSFVRTIL